MAELWLDRADAMPRPCRVWVNRVVLTAQRSLPVYPRKHACSEPVGMSQKCQERI